MKKIRIIALFLLLTVMPVYVFGSIFDLQTDGLEGFDYYTYVGTTADDITVRWDEPADFDSTTDDFEVVIYNPERDITKDIGFTTDFQVTFKTAKTGHWICKVRAREKVADSDPVEYNVSEWSESTNKEVASVNGEAKGWWLFTWLKPTGAIIIGTVKDWFGKWFRPEVAIAKEEDNMPTFFTGLDIGKEKL